MSGEPTVYVKRPGHSRRTVLVSALTLVSLLALLAFLARAGIRRELAAYRVIAAYQTRHPPRPPGRSGQVRRTVIRVTSGANLFDYFRDAEWSPQVQQWTLIRVTGDGRIYIAADIVGDVSVWDALLTRSDPDAKMPYWTDLLMGKVSYRGASSPAETLELLAGYIGAGMDREQVRIVAGIDGDMRAGTWSRTIRQEEAEEDGVIFRPASDMVITVHFEGDRAVACDLDLRAPDPPAAPPAPPPAPPPGSTGSR